MILTAGPCSAESFEQLYSTAQALLPLNIDYFRAGLWKPRTRPSSFEGVKDKGLDWMVRIQKDLKLKICTEIASADMADKCAEYNFDAVWIGARTTQNPFTTEDIARALEGTNMCVMVKNPLNPDVKLWLGAVERLEKHGIKKIMAVHRGFSLSYNKYKQSPLWRIPLEFKRLRQDIPIICDPSHIAGDRMYVGQLAHDAVAIGFDGLMVETHISPDSALTDAKQQITPEQLTELIGSIPSVTDNHKGYDTLLAALRKQIDDIDDVLIGALKDRMDISKKIALIKKQNNMRIFQPERWQEVVKNVTNLAEDKDLDGDFVKEIYGIIHQDSVKTQNVIINKSEFL